MTRTESEEDDLLREAADPTTPGERLRTLWRETLEKQGRAFAHANRLALFAIMCNPSLPLDMLRSQLRLSIGDAWYNPMVPVLLLSEPSSEYPMTALRLLASRGIEECCIAADETRVAAMHAALAPDLAAAVALWASVPEGKAPRTREFARHLAGLFDLPWPTAPDDPASPLAALLPHADGLPAFLEAAGYRVRLDVRRADGQPLTADDRRALALAVESHQHGGSDRSDDELAGAGGGAASRSAEESLSRTPTTPHEPPRTKRRPT